MRTRALASMFVTAIVIGLSSACSDPTVPELAPRAAVPATQGPQKPPEFPALARPGTAYVGTSDIYTPKSLGRQVESRYALFDDGTFELQFIGVGESFAYKGRWTRAGSTITFDWDGWSAAGPWGATGTLQGDTLAVKYNVIMQLTDFIDGTYVRAAAGS